MKEKHNMITLPTGESLINFRKFQQIGEHLSEIQQYQNMPYEIPANLDIQRELKRLNPMKGFVDENTFQNYLMTLKERIEPADSSPRTFVSESARGLMGDVPFFSQLVGRHKPGEHIRGFRDCLARRSIRTLEQRVNPMNNIISSSRNRIMRHSLVR